jgi:exodeoxyribonuclease-3
MIIATWNVNSIRARQDRLVAFLQRAAPDVLCLQELKVADEDFPHELVQSLGYHAAVHGQRAYNGVAILAREPLSNVAIGLGDDVSDPQARLIAVSVGGVRIVSVYVPNGQTVGSEKWAYKLHWIDRLGSWLGRTASPDQPVAILGDFNVAPDDRDVARPEEWQGSVLCHEEARAALRRVLSWGLVDAVRLHHQGPGPYSWWDYRMLAFPKGNGLRIDHALLTHVVAARCTKAWVDRDERKGKLSSDHAPVLIELSPGR